MVENAEREWNRLGLDIELRTLAKPSHARQLWDKVVLSCELLLLLDAPTMDRRAQTLCHRPPRLDEGMREVEEMVVVEL